MEEKQGKSCGKDSTSSEDDSSTQRRAVEEEHEQNHSGSYYSAHIASVCEALNAQAEKSTSRFEELMLIVSAHRIAVNEEEMKLNISLNSSVVSF
jgi:hypothetical protein